MNIVCRQIRRTTRFTELLDASLEKLRMVLKSPAVDRIETKGTQSVCSPVTNIGLSLDDVVDALGDQIAPGCKLVEIGADDVDGALEGVWPNTDIRLLC